MNDSDEYELIDCHLAGVLEPEDEARLEGLIRTDPEWARRYGEAEELARLMRAGIGGPSAPASVKRAVRDRIEASRKPALPMRRLLGSRRQWLVAAAVLCAVGLASVFLPSAQQDLIIPVAYSMEPLPLKDLARSSDVLMLGRTEGVDGRVRFRLETSLYGDPGRRACELPSGVEGGLRVALFGRFAGTARIEIVGAERGIVHLDGLQSWEGRDHAPEAVQRLLERSPDLRTSASALADLRSFLDSSRSLEGLDPEEGLYDSAPVTARFLGRFDPTHTRPILMELIMSPEKDPRARNAGAEALVEADPLGTCRMLLKRMLTRPVEGLHAESEDGVVMLRCLELIQVSGSVDLAGDLRTLSERVHCPVLRRVATAALGAVLGEGPRTPVRNAGNQPVRVRVDGHEGVVLPGCRGEKRGLLVVFRGGLPLAALNMLVNRALGQGRGVLLLPEGVSDVGPWLPLVKRTGLAALEPLQFVGLGSGASDALRAARVRQPERVALVGAPPAALGSTLEEVVSTGVAIEVWPLKGERVSGAAVKVFDAPVGSLNEILMKPALWMSVLPAD